MNRIGWLATIVAVAMLFNNKEATPKPVEDTQPKPVVVVDPTPAPAPVPTPTPRPDTVLLDKLDVILGKLDLASLQTLVEKLEAVDAKKLKTMIDLLNKYGEQEQLAKLQAASTPPPQTICPCRGNDKNGCLCLKAGVKCHCTKEVGSIWQKTTMKANVSTGQPVTASPPASPPSTPVSVPAGNGYPVTQRGAWLYWVADGVQWDNQGSGAQEGQVYGGRFTYSNGLMHDATVRPASPPPRQAARVSGGYWKTVCHGNYCTREWVPF